MEKETRMIIIEKDSFWSRYANKIVSSQIQLNFLFYFYVTASSAVVRLNFIKSAQCQIRNNFKIGEMTFLRRLSIFEGSTLTSISPYLG